MKRLLTRLLALTLLVTALPFAGAAFTDEKSIAADFTLAVTAMAEKGIIGGFPDGSFGPKKNLTRAQAAKILCVMLEGAEKADALTKTDTGFADVPASHWAAKYIAYCVEKNIVAGVGDGKFDPDGKLTTAAFAKMLLVAYGADAAKMTGKDWVTGVKEAAEPTLLTYHLKNGIQTGFMPRQEAAQMAWNALYYASALAAADKKDLTKTLPAAVPEKFKVLFIGTSGSADCMQSYLYELLQDAGVKEIVLGNLWSSSTRLIEHADYSIQGTSKYTYAKTTTGEWSSEKGKTFDDAVLDEDWDVIITQYGVSKTTDETTYHPWLEVLLYALQTKRPDAIFAWNLNWALQDGTKSTQYFGTLFDRNQLKMYDAIIRATKNQALPEKRLQVLIPTGTALQNARSSYLGDTMTRDGQHLDKGIGRYVAAMTVCCSLTGVDPAKLTYAPDTLTKGQVAVAKESVANALKAPLEITQSKIMSEP